jgi:tetratricopeptide (TPR) repeat protein
MNINKNMQKSEIEKFLSDKGDFVQIDYLGRFLKENPPLAIKRFAHEKLAELYQKKSMFSAAAKMYDSLAIISISFSEKIKNYVKETEMYIKSGEFNRADEAMKKALGEANASQRGEIYFSIKDFYKRQAQVYEKELRRSNAVRIYEKLLEMNISDSERAEIKDKLATLYKILGKIEKLRKV